MTITQEPRTNYLSRIEAIELNERRLITRTMNEESKNDVVQEARELMPRIGAAIKRVTSGHGAMRIPAHKEDPDLVLADCALSIPLLCLEVEQLRSLNQTQSDSIRHLQEQLKTADELHRVTVEARVKAENESVALRDACQKFVHWYAQDSSEFNRDSAYDAAVAALGKRTCKECGALMDSAKGERCDHCEGRIDAWLDDPLHGVRKC